MNEHRPRLAGHAELRAWLAGWKGQLLSRRRFLLQMAGGSLAALFPLSGLSRDAAPAEPNEATYWQVLDAVQQHLFPSETDAPGAREIKALDYLRIIVADDSQDAEERAFILQGAGWLEDMAQQLTGLPFTALDEEQRERVLRRIEQSTAGGNWLSLLLLYLIEALGADPVYGCNPDGVGWRWLAHIPGFPRPPADKRYPDLLER
jgi:gluconate 2-dehydrogenase gamma chain